MADDTLRKTCSACKQDKSVSEFDRRKHLWKSACKDCRATRERGKPRRARPVCTAVLYDGPQIDREAARSAGLRRYFSREICPRGHLAERSVASGACTACLTLREQARRRDNLARERARVQAWKAKNKDRVRAYAADKNRIAQYNHTRRAMKVAATGRLSSQDIEDVRRSQRDRCACCGIPLKGKGEADHIEPLSKGGLNTKRNIQMLCLPCNRSKHSADPIDFMRERGFLL